mmetsp:Transcript_121056/g.328506  ORF Transcript_121056/g.328506 Transcript_121056/m.328506 type:complete len:213 (+) Transcript_121056:1071-1709(+)
MDSGAGSASSCSCCGTTGTAPKAAAAALPRGAGAGAALAPQICSRTFRARSVTAGSVGSGGSSVRPARNCACCKARASCMFSVTNALATSGALRARRCISPRMWITCLGVSVSMSRAISARSALSAAATRAFWASSCSRSFAMRSATVCTGTGGSSGGGAGPPPPPPPPDREPPRSRSSSALGPEECSSRSAPSTRSLRPLYSTLLSFSIAA